MNLGVPELGLILLAVLVLFGYRKLPDASRSFGRSLRIFKGEMQGLREDGAARARAVEPPDGAAAGSTAAQPPAWAAESPTRTAQAD